MLAWLKKRVSKWWQGIEKKLDNIAKENEKNFGKGRLDCCQLNRPTEKKL